MPSHLPRIQFTPTEVDVYSYRPPEVVSITPTSGFATSGGSALTVVGRGFGVAGQVAVRELRVGGQSCQTEVVHISDSKIICPKTPAGQGTNDVLVTVANQTSSGGKNLFTYERPKISKLIPSVEADPGGGTLIIIGEYLGTTAQNAAGNVSVSIGDWPCKNVSVISAETVLQCEYAPGAGTGLHVTATIRDPSMPRKDWTSNSGIFSYAEAVKQYVVTAAFLLDKPALVHGVARAVEQALVSNMALRQALSDRTMGNPRTLGLENTVRSTEGPLLHFEVSVAARTDSVALLLLDAFNGTQIAKVIQNATSSASASAAARRLREASSAVRVTNYSRISSVFCAPGEYRMQDEGVFFCSACLRDSYQPFGSVRGEPCLPCPDSGTLDCDDVGTVLPAPRPGSWRNVHDAADQFQSYDFIKYSAHACTWTMHPVCEGGNTSGCANGHDERSPLCAICEPEWHM